jgi:adenylate cyclase
MWARRGSPASPSPAKPPGTFERIPFARLLAPGAEADEQLQKAVRGKVVIVTYEPSGSQDMHPTPYSLGFWGRPGRDMSGAEIHANVIETILTGKAPRPVSRAGGMGGAGRVSGGGPGPVFAAVHLVGSGRPDSPGRHERDPQLCPVSGLSAAAGGPGPGGLLVGYVGALGLRLTGEERERARLRRLFGRYVSEEVVEKLLAQGARPDLGGEAYQVTVLFSDIRNFTTISENLTPAQVVEMLNRYFTLACEPILAAGGTVDKFVGDAIMAVFGAPASHPDHARRAVRPPWDWPPRPGNSRGG